MTTLPDVEREIVAALERQLASGHRIVRRPRLTVYIAPSGQVVQERGDARVCDVLGALVVGEQAGDMPLHVFVQAFVRDRFGWDEVQLTAFQQGFEHGWCKGRHAGVAAMGRRVSEWYVGPHVGNPDPRTIVRRWRATDRGAGDRRPCRVRRWGMAVAIVGALTLASLPASGSMFGEENTSLVAMLAQLIGISQQMATVSDYISRVYNATTKAVTIAQTVYSGVQDIRSYSLDAFLGDVKADLYSQYPGFAKLEYASENLRFWDETIAARSTLRTYDVIGATVADLAPRLRADAKAGRQNVDRELLRKGEAASGFVAASAAEAAIAKTDNQIQELARRAQNAQPGVAAQLSVKAQIIAATQQSHLMRLLARQVRLHSVDETIEYAHEIDEHNAIYAKQDVAQQFAREALRPPRLLAFNDGSP